MALNRHEKTCLVIFFFFFWLGLLLECTSHEAVAIYPLAVAAAAWVVLLRERIERRIAERRANK